MKKFILAFACIFSVVSFTGCLAPDVISPIVQAYVKWKEGEAFKYYNWDVRTVYNATKRALDDLGYEVTTDEPYGEGYYIIAGNGDQFKIWIELKDNNTCALRIRVNFMGDKPYAEMIYRNVDNQISVIEWKRLNNKLPH